MLLVSERTVLGVVDVDGVCVLVGDVDGVCVLVGVTGGLLLLTCPPV